MKLKRKEQGKKKVDGVTQADVVEKDVAKKNRDFEGRKSIKGKFSIILVAHFHLPIFFSMF